MKKIKIGDTELNVCEDLKDITAYRYKEFKEMVIRAFEDSDVPTVAAFKKAVIEAIDSKSQYRTIQALESFFRASERKTIDIDSMDLAFSLITLGEGEDPLNIDANYHREKMEKLIKSGMSADVAPREVYFFMAGHPIEFRGFGEIIALLAEISKQENLNEPQ
jgi:hypothetical protein